MSEGQTGLSRRGFLRGLGACVAVPGMQSLGAAPVAAAARTAVTASGAPLRMAFLYVPNGVIMDRWRPHGTGDKFRLNDSMAPLEDFRDEFQVVKGFEQANGWAGPDGAGDHARSNSTFLTGVRPRKTAGSDIKLGISVDQLAANHVGHVTRFPSLELSCDEVRKSGACDSGYSCAYQFNISWRSERQPMTPESNPRLVFERLFGGGSDRERQAGLAMRREQRRSILDFVKDDARAMQKRLGQNDRRKLDEYMTGVREIEQRIERAESFGKPVRPDVDPPAAGVPAAYEEHIRLMFDMLLLAFKTDSTRIASYLLAHDGSNRSFRDIGVSEGHHALSHHRNNRDKIEKITRIDRFYIEQLAYFLGRMRATRDVDGKSLLDNSMIVWGGGLSNADRHTHNDLPVILAGRGGGALNPGRHLELDGDIPLNNLYVRMLREMGAPVKRFGDSTGIVTAV
ncbi:MAG: DUF1552 domain-containing protein [Akkermansiaceae bacterium]|nr:DUF1552 domain-containing protein [Akkermansiaceae bacterium]NNM28210.1 DUF1552 domain-containing protein [Akkermansiaceae bacterium]